MIEKVETRPTEAQLFVTFECRNMCGYCNLPRLHEKFGTIPAEDWVTVIGNLGDIGVTTVKILGGEPTNLDHRGKVEDVISGVRKAGMGPDDMRISLVTNGLFDEGRLDTILDSGPDVLVCSIDTLPGIDGGYNGPSTRKSLRGYDMLRKAGSGNGPLDGLEKALKYGIMPVANTVITRKNLPHIRDQIGVLSGKGIYTNLCPVIHSGSASYEDEPVGFGFRKMHPPPDEYRLTGSGAEEVRETMRRLIQDQKEKGLLVLSPEKYLEDMHVHAVDPNSWQCSMPTQWQVAPDGEIYLCNEMIGGTGLGVDARKPIDRHGLLERWYETRGKVKCSGCAWSTFIVAEDNYRAGRRNYDVS